jgi:hypothetical protein
METRSKTGSLPPSKHIYKPTDPVAEGQLKFPSARNWTKEHLDLLGVDFRRDYVDLNYLVMKVDKSRDWTEEMRESMMPYVRFDCLDFNTGNKELRSVDLSQKKPGLTNLFKAAPHFVYFFEALKRLNTPQERKLKEKKLREMKQQEVTASSEARPITPDQPTSARDPDFSGSSATSQDEDASKMLVNHFLFATMTVLEENFYRISWHQSGGTVELVHA